MGRRIGSKNGISVNERFEQCFEIMQSECWEWTDTFAKDGYGRFYINGKTIGAHRASYLIYKGDIVNNLFVLHSCDNPKCVNPEHLWLGTQKMNMDDAKQKGRLNNGGGRKNGISHPSITAYMKGCRCAGCKLLEKDRQRIKYLKYKK